MLYNIERNAPSQLPQTNKKRFGMRVQMDLEHAQDNSSK